MTYFVSLFKIRSMFDRFIYNDNLFKEIQWINLFG